MQKNKVRKAKKLADKEPKTLLHTFHPLNNRWSGTNMAFDLLEKFIDDRHSVLRCYPGFNEAFPTWQEERGQVRRIREKVLKLVWDEAQRKHDAQKDETA